MKVPRKPLLVVLALSLILSLPWVSVQAAEFRAFFYHIHTIYSLDNPGWEPVKPSVAQVMARADRVAGEMGLEASVAITDHRNIDAYFDPGFVPFGVAWPMKGEEWGRSGHAGALNYTGDTPITDYQDADRYERMVEETHARGGIVIANHPRPGDWKTDRRLGVDGIEVWNTLIWGNPNQLGLDWWHHLLAAGERITAVGGSDSHFVFLPIESPMNLVWSESNQPDDVVDGFLGGRLIILAAPGSARVYPTADASGNGEYDDAMTGDVIEIAEPTVVGFRMLVEGADETDTLTLLDRTGVFYSGNVGVGPGWDGDSYTFSREYAETDRDFVRVELRSQNRLPHCIANPIYLVGALAPAGTEGVIQGVVRDKGGALLQGVTVTATPGEFSLDVSAANGTYSILLPNGTYRVTATRSGYLTTTQTDVVVTSDGVTLDFALSPTACGTVPHQAGDRTPAVAWGLVLLLPAGMIWFRLRLAPGRFAPRCRW